MFIHSDSCPCCYEEDNIYEIVKTADGVGVKWNCLGAPHCDHSENIEAAFRLALKEKRGLFLTINFGDLDPKKIVNLLDGKSQFPFEYPCIYTFEFYNSLCKPHFHIHILYNLGKERVRRKRTIKKWSDYFNISPNFIDYKFSNKTNRYNQLSQYIQGNKTERKQEALDLDDAKRVEYQILKYYVSI